MKPTPNIKEFPGHSNPPPPPKCSLNPGRITGIILIGENDELFYAKDENGKACPFTVITHEPVKEETRKKGKVAKKIYKRIKELTSEAEHYFQEAEMIDEGHQCLAKIQELEQILKYLK